MCHTYSYLTSICCSFSHGDAVPASSGSLWSCAASIRCCLQPAQEVRRAHGLLLCKSEKSATEMDFERKLNFAEQCLCLLCLPCFFLFCSDPFQTHSANLTSRPPDSASLSWTMVKMARRRVQQQNLCMSAHYVSNKDTTYTENTHIYIILYYIILYYIIL